MDHMLEVKDHSMDSLEVAMGLSWLDRDNLLEDLVQLDPCLVDKVLSMEALDL
jgi:hypothetical protein